MRYPQFPVCLSILYTPYCSCICVARTRPTNVSACVSRLSLFGLVWCSSSILIMFLFHFTSAQSVHIGSAAIARTPSEESERERETHFFSLRKKLKRIMLLFFVMLLCMSVLQGCHIYEYPRRSKSLRILCYYLVCNIFYLCCLN